MSIFLGIVAFFAVAYIIVNAVEFFKKLFFTILDIMKANPWPFIAICAIICFLIGRLIYHLIMRVRSEREYRDAVRKLDLAKRVKSIENENAQNELLQVKIKAVEDSYTPQICPNCAAAIKSGERFCQYCGTKIVYTVKK